MRKMFSFKVTGAFALSVMAAGAAASQTPETVTWPAAPPATTQGPQTEKAVRKTLRRPPASRVTVVPSQEPIAPQVVTIIHRLSGVKILRFLLRQSGQGGIVETLDPDTMNNDAHASIIAGWALDDGKTVAARLPQAVAEIEIKEFEGPAGNRQAEVFATTPFMFAR